jgi:WD repeat-containing protein 1 (actin-interacting protein 1)
VYNECGTTGGFRDALTYDQLVGTYQNKKQNKKSTGKIILYDVTKREVITSRWAFHSARVNSLSWTADSLHCASGALDTHVYVWSVQKPMKNIAIKNAVAGGVNAVLWLSGGSDEGSGRLAGTGVDAGIKVWEIKLHA